MNPRKTTNPRNATKTETFEQIAREHLHIETLESRRSDRLDFHEVSIWGLKNALYAAYRAGMEATKKTNAKEE